MEGNVRGLIYKVGMLTTRPRLSVIKCTDLPLLMERDEDT
jgi:hypothetical protein